MRMARWVAAYDLHGDQQDAPTVRAFKAFCDDFKPQIRIAGGDIFDFRWLRQAASENERCEQTARADMDAGIDFLSWYKPTVFLWGNHDHRIIRAMSEPVSRVELRELASQWHDWIIAKTPGCKHLPYCKRNGVHRLGDFSFIHGFAHGVNATRQAAMLYGNVIHGHTHRQGTAHVEGIDQRVGYAAGCLCRLDMDYNRTHLGTLAQRNGWVYGWMVNDRLIVQHAQKVGNVWVCPENLTTVRG